VADRVADERGGGRDAVALDDAVDELLAARERFVPRHLAPRVAVAHHRLAQPVGVVVQVSERRALGAQVALRPHVVAVTADQLDVLVLDVDLQPTHALTERTRDEMSLHQSTISQLRRAGPDGESAEPGARRRGASPTEAFVMRAQRADDSEEAMRTGAVRRDV